MNMTGEGKKINKITEFFKEVKKVIWPTPKETFRNTWITLVMIFIVGVFVFLIDYSLINLLGMIMGIAK
jgi:preprotein translocase subunit SecE